MNLKEAMSVEEFLASACLKKGLSPQEHFVRIKKRRDMDENNSFIPHRSDLIDSYVSSIPYWCLFQTVLLQGFFSHSSIFPGEAIFQPSRLVIAKGRERI